jgi:hypothetical protein
MTEESMTSPKVSQEAREAAIKVLRYSPSALLNTVQRRERDRIAELFAQFEQLIRSMVIDEAAGVYREALTPSGDTKGAYMGEIKDTYVEWDEFGDERTVHRPVSWDATKATMKMILARAEASIRQLGERGR